MKNLHQLSYFFNCFSIKMANILGGSHFSKNVGKGFLKSLEIG
ncbi:MAG: hypothetical protein RL757_2782 [Bacteroidota bacterium]|jgi:hypothetical protein